MRSERLSRIILLGSYRREFKTEPVGWAERSESHVIEAIAWIRYARPTYL
jgi:hypothetical protein